MPTRILPPLETINNEAAQITWHEDERLAHVVYTPGSTLTAKDGLFLTSALAGWIKDDGAFGVLADAKGLKGTDGEYRAIASSFFRQHRSRAAIALINMGSVIAVLVEMFRIGTRIRLKAFSNEADARVWLLQQAKEPM